jgi:hypothetical protein
MLATLCRSDIQQVFISATDQFLFLPALASIAHKTAKDLGAGCVILFLLINMKS